MKRTILLALLALAFLTLTNNSARAADRLFGDWGGAQPWFESHGIEVEAITTNEYVANTKGGVSRTSGVLGNFDLTAAIDTSKAGLWEDGTFFTYFLGNYGKDPSSFVGDSQVTSNIEAYDTFKL